MNENIRLIGRYEKEETGISFSWPGFKIKGKFKGTSLSLNIVSSRCFLLIEINGEKYKLEVTPDKSSYCLADNLKNQIYLFSITLCHEVESKVQLESIKADGLFYPLKEAKHKIEFIGDSLTVGYGNSSPDEKWRRRDSYIYYTSSPDSYASIAGRFLNADVMLTAYSGKGLTHNYNNDSPGVTVPVFYNSTHRFLDSQLWDRSQFNPDFTVINLGTNDFSNDIDLNEWQNSYIEFINKIRISHPDTKIILISPNSVDKGAVSKVADISGCLYYSYNVPYSALDYHPNIKEHMEIASGLVDVIKGLVEKS